MCTESRRQRGITLIEQVVFIVVMAVGVVGLVSTMNSTIARSADPQVTKQLIALAEGRLATVLQARMTWCDGGDANAYTATAFSECAATPQDGLGVQGALDNVTDYAGFAWDPLPGGYRAEVAVAWAGNAMGLADDTAATAVTVTACRSGAPASCAGRDSIALTGYRFRYAPRF